MKVIKYLSIGIFGVASLFICSCNSRHQGEEAKDQKDEMVEMEGTTNEEVDLMNNPAFEVKDNLIFPKNQPLVVDFYATWCGPCKQYSPIFHQVAKEFSEAVTFISIDTDKYPDIAKAYKINAVPTTVFILMEGAEFGRQEGVMDKSKLVEIVNQLMAASGGEGNPL